MNSFSQRYGLKPIKNIIQVDSMDQDLRTSLWNILQMLYWEKAVQANKCVTNVNDYNYKQFKSLFKLIWLNYFKKELPHLSYSYSLSTILEDIHKYFFSCQWYEVYDFIEFIANKFDILFPDNEFKQSCNEILKRELSAYRFVDKQIIKITSEIEIAEIEEALKNSEPYKTVNTHLHRALKLLSDRQSPDYRNSIKESISAVESIAKIITEDDKATLGDALKKIDKKIKIHKVLIESFLKIYGYTNDADGIRHGLMEDSNLDFEDAKFMLVSCSAFVNYLIVKIEKAKIQDIPND